MKKIMDKTHRFLYIASFTIIAILFIYIGIQSRKNNRLEKENQIQAIELSTLKDTVAVYQDKNGYLTYKLGVVEVSHSNLKESLTAANFDIKNLKDRDIKWRKVTSALRMQLAASGSGTVELTDTFRVEVPAETPHAKPDTIRFQKFDEWSNDYLTLYNGKIEKKKLDFDYRYQTGIDFITEQHRKGTTVSVMLSDSLASVTSANSIFVKNKKHWYQKPWLWGVAGFAAGILIAK